MAPRARAIFRGEEIGKEKLRELAAAAGPEDPAVLLGGESVARYAIRGPGLRIPAGAVKKGLERYRRPKIVVQKSAGRLIAAFDREGRVFPQSVYGILLDDPRIGYPFLLTQLNSRLLGWYMHVMFTGYKLVQPQIEIEDIRRLPVAVPEFENPSEARRPSLEAAKSLYRRFLETDDPGWVLDYVEENQKLSARSGSAQIHDLLEFLGTRLIENAAAGREDESAGLERERLDWLTDLLIYRIFGLELEEIETVEKFFAEEDARAATEAAGKEGNPLPAGDPETRDPALFRRGESHLYAAGEQECDS